MKRRWFQMHLSTAIAVMIVASILLGINFRRRNQSYHGGAVVSGWPFPVATYAKWEIGLHSLPPGVFDELDDAGKEALSMSLYRIRDLDNPEWHYKGIALNLLFGMLMLTFTASLCEFYSRRREIPKP